MPSDPDQNDVPRDRPKGSPVVLIVDDDAGMRAYMRQCLAPLQIHVADACDGKSALSLIEHELLDDLVLVLADIHMPVMGGLELKVALSSSQRWRSVPVVLVTGESLRARDGPALRKPFNARRLGEAVRDMLPAPKSEINENQAYP